MNATPAAVARGPALWRRHGTGVLVRVPGGDTVELEGTAAGLWDRLRRPRRIDELAAELARHHRAGVDTVAADLADLVADLVARGALVVVDAAVETVADGAAVIGNRPGTGGGAAGTGVDAPVPSPVVAGGPADLLASLVTDGPATAGRPVRIDDEGVDRLLDRARRERLLGVLAAAVEGGDVDATPAARRRVREAHRDALLGVLALDELLLDAVAALDDAGIDHRVLKGSALAHLAHPDPAGRLWADVDLLVPAAELDRAVAALAAVGARRLHPPLRPDHDRRFAKAVTLRTTGGAEIDLHRTLAAGPYGLVADPVVWFEAPASSFVLAGRSLPTLDVAGHLVHAAAHLALGDTTPRLGNVRDLVLLLGRDDLDPEEVRGRAARAGLTAPLAEGIRRAVALGAAPVGPGGELVAWAGAHRPPARDRRLLAAYTTRRGRYGAQVRASLRALPRWSDRAALARAVLWPDRANLASRGLDRRRHLRRLLRGR